MNDFEFQLHRDILRFTYESQLSRSLPPGGQTFVRSAGQDLPEGSPLLRIPEGAQAHITFRIEPAPSTSQFRREPLTEMVFQLGPTPLPKGPPIGEITQLGASAIATVTITRSSDGALIELFEVPGLALCNLVAEHENEWSSPARPNDPVYLLGSRARICTYACALRPQSTDGDQATELVQLAFRPASAGMQGRQLFPLPPLLGPPPANPAWLNLSPLTSALRAPIARSALALDQGAGGMGPHLTLRAELSPTPNQHPVSQQLPGDLADWAAFYSAHPEDRCQGGQWSLTLPADALVKSLQRALVGQERPQPGVEIEPNSSVTWTSGGELKLVLRGKVWELGSLVLTNPWGEQHPVHFEATVHFSFRSELRALQRVRGGQGVTETGLALVVDARVSLDIDDYDLFVVSIIWSFALAILTAGIGGVIGGLIGAAIGAGVGLATAAVLVSVLGAILPGLALGLVKLPSTSLAGMQIQTRKLSDDHHEAIIDTADLLMRWMGTSGEQLSISSARGTSRGLELCGGVADLLMLLVAPAQRRLTFSASPQLEWGWSGGCSSPQRVVAVAQLQADPGSSAGLQIAQVELEDPGGHYGPGVLSLRRATASGVIVQAPQPIFEVIIQVEVPEDRPCASTQAPPMVVVITDSRGTRHRLSIAAPPPIDAALRQELDTQLARRKRLCEELRGTLSGGIGGFQIRLPVSDPPGWGQLGPGQRDLLDLVFGGLRPSSPLVVLGAGGDRLAEVQASEGGVAFLHLPLEGRTGELMIEGAGGEEGMRWGSRLRRVEVQARLEQREGRLRLTEEGLSLEEEQGQLLSPLTGPARRDRAGDRWWAGMEQEGLVAWRLVAEQLRPGAPVEVERREELRDEVRREELLRELRPHHLRMPR